MKKSLGDAQHLLKQEDLYLATLASEMNDNDVLPGFY